MTATITRDYSDITVNTLVVGGPTSTEAADTRDRGECEHVIDAGLHQIRVSWIAIGKALLRIRDGRLYTPVYDTFEGYVRKRWKFTYQRAHQLMRGANTASTMVDAGLPVPKSERSIRVLPKDKARAVAVWKTATERHGPGVTGAQVATVIKETAEPADMAEVETVIQETTTNTEIKVMVEGWESHWGTDEEVEALWDEIAELKAMLDPVVRGEKKWPEAFPDLRVRGVRHIVRMAVAALKGELTGPAA